MGDLLRPVLRGMRPVKRDAADQIRSAWPAIVGEGAARRSRVVACRDGELLIEVSSAALRQHLSVFLREDILSGLRKHLPELEVDSLKCRVSGGF
jgi:hypothetical protein